MNCWADSRVFGRVPRLRLLRTLVVFLAICDTIRRMEGARPIDLWMLVIELLVLALIAYEVIVGILRNRGDKKRTHNIRARSEKIREMMMEGQELQQEVPRFGTGPMEIAKWANAEKEWHEATKELLASYSAQAGAAFLHDTSGVAPPWWDSIAPAARNHYATLSFFPE
jgi:hypothetical protein